MIVADLDASTLARMTIRPSPVHEVIGWLRLIASGDRHPVYGRANASDRAALRGPDVSLVAAMVAGGGYQPDLLTPVAGCGDVQTAFGDQLDAVAAADQAQSATEVAWWSAGRPAPRRVRDAVDRGDLGRLAARGLAAARRAMGDRWESVTGMLERSTHEAAATAAREGVGAVLDGMHRDVRWTGGELRIAKPFDESVRYRDQELVLSPSVLTWPRLTVQVVHESRGSVVFPATAFGEGRHRGGGGGLGELLGSSRAALLRDLDVPRTTTELSARHSLAKATVSHHLGALAAAGLLVASRRGRHVDYRRSARGDLFLA
ncbi:helix-turn-helix domain-containing protein [Nocardioides sp. HM23]|uniref:helix-turn-helix domain-containing protein n=1 Tax=Nocardioides bizhenqiangii TaxID=3095076 RepID=UPI002ACAA135|nr:helix-turn-helix domain-containing protein [Nocardioides sp. HM23]MDZ5619435.1 helix-turn-helix domain-containing protein [Nocardioides sp. HM23]